jgi:uncharacterized protein (TIGR02246 family)
MHDELIALERRFWEAAGDPAFYEDHFADDGRCVFGFGLLDKAATVASMASAAPWGSFALHDVEVVALHPDAAVLTYTATADRDGEEHRAAVSSAYARRDGRWQLVVHHQTPRP